MSDPLSHDDLNRIGNELMAKVEAAYGQARKGPIEVAFIVSMDVPGDRDHIDLVYASNHRRFKDTVRLLELAAGQAREEADRRHRPRLGRRRRSYADEHGPLGGYGGES